MEEHHRHLLNLSTLFAKYEYTEWRPDKFKTDDFKATMRSTDLQHFCYNVNWKRLEATTLLHNAYFIDILKWTL